MTQQQLLELVTEARRKLSNSGSTKVTRDTILYIQDIIRELHEKRLSSNVSNDSFIGNLPNKGKVEGPYNEVVDNVKDGIERIGEHYKDGAYSNNAELLMRNITNMLTKENYDTVFLENICKNKSQKLIEISNGIF